MSFGSSIPTEGVGGGKTRAMTALACVTDKFWRIQKKNKGALSDAEEVKKRAPIRLVWSAIKYNSLVTEATPG
jgi:hypothetical protein